MSNMVTTAFQLKELCSKEEEFNSWLKEKKLLLNFDKLKCCICSDGSIKLMRDCSFRSGVCWSCSYKYCRKRFPILYGSWFGSLPQIPPEKIIHITYLWVYEYPPDLVMHEVGISVNSIVQWYHYCREVCIDFLDEDQRNCDQIGGSGLVVEIDICAITSKYHRGKHVGGKLWGFGGIESDNKTNCFFQIVSDNSAETLIPIIKRHVRLGTTIVSQCCKAYDSLSSIGYDHEIINVPKSSVISGKIECTWYRFKATQRRHGQNFNSKASYFAEFIFRRKFFSENVNFFNFFITEAIPRVFTTDKALQTLIKRPAPRGLKQLAVSSPPINVLPSPAASVQMSCLAVISSPSLTSGSLGEDLSSSKASKTNSVDLQDQTQNSSKYHSEMDIGEAYPVEIINSASNKYAISEKDNGWEQGSQSAQQGNQENTSNNYAISEKCNGWEQGSQSGQQENTSNDYAISEKCNGWEQGSQSAQQEYTSNKYAISENCNGWEQGSQSAQQEEQSAQQEKQENSTQSIDPSADIAFNLTKLIEHVIETGWTPSQFWQIQRRHFCNIKPKDGEEDYRKFLELWDRIVPPPSLDLPVPNSTMPR